MTEPETTKLLAAIQDAQGALAEIQINIVPQLKGADAKLVQRLKTELTTIDVSLDQMEFLAQ